MPLYIPDDYANVTMKITNTVAGISAGSSIAIGLALTNGTLTHSEVLAISNVIRDGLRPQWDGQWALGPSKIVWRESGVLHVDEDSTLEAGTHVSEAYCSPAVAMVITKNTGLLGKAHRGRLYMPGVCEADVDEAGIIGGTRVTSWQTTIDTLQTTLIGLSEVSSLALFHEAGGPLANSPDEWKTSVVRNVVGTMRPRQRR